MVPKSSLIVDLLRVSSRMLDHILVEGQDKVKGMRVRLSKYPSVLKYFQVEGHDKIEKFHRR
jgi:hypothetical protein